MKGRCWLLFYLLVSVSVIFIFSLSASVDAEYGQRFGTESKEFIETNRLPIYNVTTPQLSGPTRTNVFESFTITASKSNCSCFTLKKTIQYEFEINGKGGKWTNENHISLYYRSPNTIEVRARARCTACETVSAWSDIHTVEIVYSCSMDTPHLIGQTNGMINTTYRFSVHSTSNCRCGADVLYQFNWLSFGGWATQTISDSYIDISYPVSGTYYVRVRTKCTESEIMSDWSSLHSIVISICQVSTPQVSGPISGNINTPYTFTASEEICACGAPVEYQFGWIDAIAGYATLYRLSNQLIYTWENPGSYWVRVSARCSETQITSGASDKHFIEITGPDPCELNKPTVTGRSEHGTGLAIEFTASEESCACGAPVEYRFIWEDTLTEWSSIFDLSNKYSITWENPGSYWVRVITRCSETAELSVISDKWHIDIEQKIDINVSANPPDLGRASVSPAILPEFGGYHKYGDEIEVIAIPFEDAYFVNWTEEDDVVSTDRFYTFTATSDRDLVANFEEFSFLEFDIFEAFDRYYEILPDYTVSSYSGLLDIDSEEIKYRISRHIPRETLNNLIIGLNWPGSELKLSVYDPEGHLQAEESSNEPPILLEINDATEGDWTIKVTPEDIPYSDYPYALIVGEYSVPAEEDADLSNLTLSKGTLTPPFDAAITAYSVNVAYDVESIDITATLSDENASLTIDGITTGSGLSRTVSLGEQGTSTQIDIVVTAEDKETIKTYSITVNRGEDVQLPALYWQHDDGDLKVWFMNGTEKVGSEVFDSLDSGWEVKGVVDATGNGTPDIYLFNRAAGEVELWLMEGLEKETVIEITNPHPDRDDIDPVWEMMAVYDLNGSGEPDIIWQALEGPNEGHLAVWMMEDQQAYQTNRLYNVPGKPYVDPNWEIGSIYDLLGDGEPEVIWQAVGGAHEDQLAYWKLDMETFERVDSARIYNHPGDPSFNADWRLNASVDLFGDGIEEFLFHHINGGLAYWQLEVDDPDWGVIRDKSGRLEPKSIDIEWTLVGASTYSPIDVEQLTVHFIDVGQGDSIFIDTTEQNILIDAGDRGILLLITYKT